MTATEKRRIADIIIGDRHRKDLGDLAALAESIKTEGLLQAIGITPENELVFGERRLRACRDILGWDEIDVRIVNVSGIAQGEYAENEIRKDFTVSERVAILKTIRRFSHGGTRASGQGENFPLEDRPATRQQASEKAGFGNYRTGDAAESVVDRGAPELVQAMDADKVSIDAAARIARLPQGEQREIVSRPEPEIRERVRQLRSNRTPAQVRGAGSSSARTKPGTIAVPLSARQAATAIMKGFGALSVIEDLIEELQARVQEARAQQRGDRVGEPVGMVQ